MIRFVVPKVPVSVNVWMRYAPQAQAAYWTRWRQWVRLSAKAAGVPDPVTRPREKRRVRVHVYRWNLLDEDNRVSCLKPILDALETLKFIRDDSTPWLELECDQTIVRDKREYRTEIEIGSPTQEKN